MYSLSCKAMGMPNCDFVAKAETQEEVISQISAHVKSAHPEKMDGMTPEKMEGMKSDMMSKMVQE